MNKLDQYLNSKGENIICFLVRPNLISVFEELWLPLQYLARKKERKAQMSNLMFSSSFPPILKRLCKAIKLTFKSKQFIATYKITLLTLFLKMTMS